MKYIILLTIINLISGCTISARNHHFELVDYESKEYNDFHNIWCFAAKQNTSVMVCSGPFKRRSESFGILIPVVPQTNRDSRLAYDINYARVIEFKNTGAAEPVILSELSGIDECAGRYAKNCAMKDRITVNPGSSVWMKVPQGKVHEFSLSVGGAKYRLMLKEFNETRWHAVSV